MSWLQTVLDVPGALVPRAAQFWSGALGWPAGDPWPGHPELRTFEPPEGHGYVHLQEVGGETAGVHLDIEAADLSVELVRLVRLGATAEPPQDRWQPMTSPGGLPFCLVPETGHHAPSAVQWAQGRRSRLVQVSIDARAALLDTELTFWREALGWRYAPPRSADVGENEFAGKMHDDAGSPLQLLFQRTEDEDGPVRAHLDLGADDIEAEVERLVALGAERLWPGRGWVAMRDPVGLVFCVTSNSPEQSRHRDLG